jgi:hypothetical protein
MYDIEKVGNNIEILEQKLKELGNKTPTDKIGYWHKLSSHCSKMSADQLKYIEKNKNVVETQKKMMDAFNLFLFEKYKEDFAEIEAFKPLCESYVNTVLSTCDEYADVLTRTLEENEELKKRISNLERKQNAGHDTKGT